MVKIGVYGVILTVTRLLPDAPRWWGLSCCSPSRCLSRSYGILQASVTSDLKRLLAYSTTENVGLIAQRRRRSSMLLPPPGDAPVAGRGHGRRTAADAEPCRLQDGPVPRRGRSCCTPPASGTWTGSAGSCAPCPCTAVDVRCRRLGAAALPVTCGLRRRVGAAAGADPRRRPGDRLALRPSASRRWRSVALTAGLGPAHVRQGVRDRVPRPAAVRRRPRPRVRGRPADARGHGRRRGGRPRARPGRRAGGNAAAPRCGGTAAPGDAGWRACELPRSAPCSTRWP